MRYLLTLRPSKSRPSTLQFLYSSKDLALNAIQRMLGLDARLLVSSLIGFSNEDFAISTQMFALEGKLDD